MKYFCFDIFIAASIVMLVVALRPVFGDCENSLRRKYGHCDGDVHTPDFMNGTHSTVKNQQQVNETSYKADPRRMATPPASSTQHDDEENQHQFKIGDIVELYGPKSTFAMPATIIGYKKQDNSTIIKYDLQSVIHNTKPMGVAPELMYPYQVYDDGMLASCNVAEPGRVYMAPCKIASHVIKKRGGFISYQVEYLKGVKKVNFPEYLPFSRVQRRINQQHNVFPNLSSKSRPKRMEGN